MCWHLAVVQTQADVDNLWGNIYYIFDIDDVVDDAIYMVNSYYNVRFPVCTLVLLSWSLV